MDFSPTSLTENLLPKSSSHPPREDKISNTAWKQPSSSSYSLHQSPQDTSTIPPKLPQGNFFYNKTLLLTFFIESLQQNDLKREIFFFDAKYKTWILFHLCWLIWCIYASLSTLPSKFFHALWINFDLEYFEEFIDRIRAPLLMTVPYWIQFAGIYLQDRLIMDIGIKLVGLYAFVVGIPMTLAGSLYLFAPEIHADFYNAPVHQSEKALLGIFKRTGEMFIYLLITYGVAKKYVSYLVQREDALKKNQ